MQRILVKGGRRLSGEVVIGGSKNAALPILFGGIVTGDVCVFSGLPRVSDVLQALEILKYLGARICFLGSGEVRVDYSTVHYDRVPAALTSPIRGSTYLLGAMLGRFGKAALGGSGGCNLGARPIDQHLKGFACLGACVHCGEEGVTVEAPDGLRGAEIFLDMPSVGATANLLLACACAHGKSVIHNAAAEPHVAALAAFLCDAGAQISPISGRTVCVSGDFPLRGTHCVIIPDMIEAGTYLAIGAACGGPICVRAVSPAHLTCFLETLQQIGSSVKLEKREITASSPSKWSGASVVTGPFPAFPTDLHPQLAAVLAARAQGSIRETVFASRFGYVTELQKMGADMAVTGSTVSIRPARLHGAKMRSPDLRGGAALLIAALAAEGYSEITNAATVGRGYEHLEAKLRALGAEIEVY